MNAPLHICQASEYGAVTACGSCGLTWDTKADRPPCKPKADPPIDLTQMIEAAREEGWRLMASQRALVAAGMRADPCMPELRKAAVMLATASLLERVKGNAKVVELLKGNG